MSDTIDLTMLSGSLRGIERELRLLRLQLDHLAGRTSGQDSRLGGIEGRFGVMEQSFHELAGEVSRGFGQMQQHLTRQEQRFDAIDAGLAALHRALEANLQQVIEIVKGEGK